VIQDNPRWHGTDALQQPALRDFAETWRDWAKEEPLPRRAHFDPVDFPRLLPWVVLMEVLPEAAEFDARIRYVGSEIVHYFNSEHITGMTLSDLGPVYWDRWADVGTRVAAARAPQYFRGAPFLVDRDFVDFELLALPLSKAGATFDFLLLALSRLTGDGSGD